MRQDHAQRFPIELQDMDGHGGGQLEAVGVPPKQAKLYKYGYSTETLFVLVSGIGRLLSVEVGS